MGHLQAIYNHKPSTYVRRYVDAPTKNLFEFGDGLSYTQFTYSQPTLSTSRIAENESARLSVTVTNSGDRDGDEVVQLYIRDNFSRVTRPVKELKGFQRIHLKAKQSREIIFDITPDTLAYYDLNMEWRVEPGDFTIMVGSSSRKRDLQTVTLTVKP